MFTVLYKCDPVGSFTPTDNIVLFIKSMPCGYLSVALNAIKLGGFRLAVSVLSLISWKEKFLK